MPVDLSNMNIDDGGIRFMPSCKVSSPRTKPDSINCKIPSSFIGGFFCLKITAGELKNAFCYLIDDKKLKEHM